MCFEEGENHSPWAIMAVEIFLKAAMSLPAIRSYPRPYSSAAAAEASYMPPMICFRRLSTSWRVQLYRRLFWTISRAETTTPPDPDRKSVV